MLNKKAQGMTQWSLVELLKLLLRVFAVIILIAVLFGFINALIKQKPLNNAHQDFERILGEIIVLEENDAIDVPILASGYKIVIRKKEIADNLGLSCRKGNYCACLQDEINEEILTCKGFDKDIEIPPVDILFEGKTVHLEVRNNKLIV